MTTLLRCSTLLLAASVVLLQASSIADGASIQRSTTAQDVTNNYLPRSTNASELDDGPAPPAPAPHAPADYVSSGSLPQRWEYMDIEDPRSAVARKAVNAVQIYLEQKQGQPENLFRSVQLNRVISAQYQKERSGGKYVLQLALNEYASMSPTGAPAVKRVVVYQNLQGQYQLLNDQGLPRLTQPSGQRLRQTPALAAAGPSSVDPRSSKVVGAARAAVFFLNLKEFSVPLDLDTISGAQQQVVAGGNNYKLDLVLVPRYGSCRQIQASAVVNRRGISTSPYESYSVTSWSYLSLALHCPNDASQARGELIGGFSATDPASQEVVKAADEAVKAYNSLHGRGKVGPVDLKRIISAQRQLVAGLNYQMTLEVKRRTVPGPVFTVIADVYRDLKGQHSLTSWTLDV